MNVCIVDDSVEIIAAIKKNLERYEKENNVEFNIETFNDGYYFLDNYNIRYYFILMDIIMPKIDGIKAAAKLREIDKLTPLIFITNMGQYAVNGYEYDAVSFILKPIHYDTFKLAIDKAIKKSELLKQKNLMFFQTKNGLIRVLVDEIIFADVVGHTLTLHTKQGNYVIKDNLTSLPKKLEKFYFIQCNVCYLLNPRYITKTTKDCFYIDDLSFPISRLRKKENMETLLKYLSFINLNN